MKEIQKRRRPTLPRHPCGCSKGIYRDNCPVCEGTGWRIDFAAIRAASGAQAQEAKLLTAEKAKEEPEG